MKYKIDPFNRIFTEPTGEEVRFYEEYDLSKSVIIFCRQLNLTRDDFDPGVFINESTWNAISSLSQEDFKDIMLVVEFLDNLKRNPGNEDQSVIERALSYSKSLLTCNEQEYNSPDFPFDSAKEWVQNYYKKYPELFARRLGWGLHRINNSYSFYIKDNGEGEKPTYLLMFERGFELVHLGHVYYPQKGQDLQNFLNDWENGKLIQGTYIH